MPSDAFHAATIRNVVECAAPRDTIIPGDASAGHVGANGCGRVVAQNLLQAEEDCTISQGFSIQMV